MSDLIDRSWRFSIAILNTVRPLAPDVDVVMIAGCSLGALRIRSSPAVSSAPPRAAC
jgi:hypothetical protein